jgi:hypothetical protein
MAVEDIGVLVPTKIPGLADAADIQEALRVYHYGGSGFEATAAQTSLPAVGIARRLLEIEDDITDLENRPSSGGDVDDDAPVAGDFTPSGIPNGYIWVDSNGSLGGAPTGATAVFTNSAPTTSITTGTIWVDKDSTTITANPFIPTATINAKGDLLVGSANDSIVTLTAGTNGFALTADSSTTSGLVWTNTLTSPTLNTPTANYAVLKSPEEKFNVVASAATGTINIDMETAGIWYYTSNSTANHTLNFRYNSSTTLNSKMSTGESVTFVWINTNGATPYYPNVIQVDGNTITPKFTGGTAYTAGNASSIDMYQYSIIKTANATFTIFAAQVKYA